MVLDTKKEHDAVIEHEGIEFILDEEIAEEYESFYMDYVDSAFRSGVLVQGIPKRTES